MKIIIKIIRVLSIIISCLAWVGYMLVTADIPIHITSNSLNIFIVIHLFVLFFIVLDFLLCIKQKYRGGFLSLFIGLIVISLWYWSYKGTNFLIVSDNTAYYIRFILLGGIVTNAIQILAQLISFTCSKKGCQTNE